MDPRINLVTKFYLYINKSRDKTDVDIFHWPHGLNSIEECFIGPRPYLRLRGLHTIEIQ